MLLLLRHCVTPNDLGSHPTLDFDESSLAAPGFQRAQQLASRLLPFPVTLIVGSDLRRAVQTVTPWAQATGVPISWQPSLRPWDRHGLIGVGEDTVNAMLEPFVRQPTLTPVGGGETFAAYIARFLPLPLALMAAPGLYGLCTHSTGVKAICAVVAGQGRIDPDVYLQTECLAPGQPALVTPTTFWPLAI